MTKNEAWISTFIGIQAPRLWMPACAGMTAGTQAKLHRIVNYAVPTGERADR